LWSAIFNPALVYGRHICIIASGRTTDVFTPQELEFWPDARHVVGCTDQFQPAREGQRTKKMLSKTQLIEKLVGGSDGLSKKNVKSLLEGLAEIAHKELKKSGTFVVPGLAKFVVVKKPATKARKGINPFTKEPTVFKAKPARKVLKIRAVKAAKDALL
jgi:DNA-binding protein HU-beta